MTRKKRVGCICEKWKANVDKFYVVFELASYMGKPYIGDKLECCPWCGRHLWKEKTVEKV